MPNANSSIGPKNDVEGSSRLQDHLRNNLASSDWPVQLKLAIACRKLADEGHALTLAGQVSARAEDESYWTTQLTSGFSHVTRSSVVRINSNLDVIEGTGIANPAVRFHLWVYKKRPDVNAIVHTHPPYCSALSMTGEELVVAHMDATVFYADCAYLPEWPGVPVSDEEGRIISQALGNKRAILLANHGFLTVGKSIEEAAYLGILFENAARLHMLARAVGPIKPIQPDLAQEAHDFLLADPIVNATFSSWGSRLLHDCPEITD